MTKVKLISWISCSRCHFIKGPLQSRAEKNGYEFEEIDVSNASPDLIEWATQLPVIWIDWEQIEYEKAIEMITKW